MRSRRLLVVPLTSAWAAQIFWLSTEGFGSEHSKSMLQGLLNLLHINVSSEILEVLNSILRKLAHVVEYSALFLVSELCSVHLANPLRLLVHSCGLCIRPHGRISSALCPRTRCLSLRLLYRRDRCCRGDAGGLPVFASTWPISPQRVAHSIGNWAQARSGSRTF
jgi:hypothetical protein